MAQFRRVYCDITKVKDSLTRNYKQKQTISLRIKKTASLKTNINIYYTYYVNDFVFLIMTSTDEEVFRFYITVNKIVPVHHFYSINLFT